MRHRGKGLLPVNSLFLQSLRRSLMLPMAHDIFLWLSDTHLWVKLPEANVILFLLSIVSQSLHKRLVSQLLSSRESTGGFYMEGAFQHRETPPLCNPSPGVQPQKLVLSMEMKEWQVELLRATVLISWLNKRRMTCWIMYSLSNHWVPCWGHVKKTRSLPSWCLLTV